jgi:hypothetical protein
MPSRNLTRSPDWAIRSALRSSAILLLRCPATRRVASQASQSLTVMAPIAVANEGQIRARDLIISVVESGKTIP